MVSSSATLISKVMHGCNAQRREVIGCVYGDGARKLGVGEGE
jgi:hypothetical protein